MFSSKWKNCTLLARTENGTNFREQLGSTKEIKSRELSNDPEILLLDI